MKKILTFILIILSASLFAANHINSNMDTYTDCDKIVIDDYSSALNDYSFVNGGKVSSTDKFVKESKKSLLWEYTIDKYRNQVVGFCKNNINLPVPKTITFYIY
ncbi:MAG: hypothetical protein KBT47_05095, partial [Armatimonadetes bacterium]|nr:hypothetical protein [Candidatus Hippobium faecium]